jgi:hypothetical protein
MHIRTHIRAQECVKYLITIQVQALDYNINTQPMNAQEEKKKVVHLRVNWLVRLVVFCSRSIEGTCRGQF